MRCILYLAVALLCLFATPASALLLKGVSSIAPPPSGYVPLCDPSLPTCATALSTERQLVSSATKAIQVYRSVDNTTQDVGFTSGGLVNTATVDTFCNHRDAGSGLISRNCWISEIYDQTGTTGCSVFQTLSVPANFPVYQVDPNHQGLPMFRKTFQGTGAHTSILDNNGGVTTAVVTPCASGLNGGPQSFFFSGNANEASACCGNFGLMENTVGITAHTMFAAMAGAKGLSFGLCSSGSPNQCGGIDTEGAFDTLDNFAAGTNNDYIDQFTWSGVSPATHLANLWMNGTQYITSRSETSTLPTQARMVWGTAGDGTGSGPAWGRTETMHLAELTPTQVAAQYANETAFVASLTTGYAGPGDLFEQTSNTAGVTGGATNQLSYASICFSFRKCWSGYEGPALNVCQGQGSGATCEDIGWVNNAIDTTTMSNFCGPGASNNCAVQIWYNEALPQNSVSNAVTTTYDAVAISNTTRPTIAWTGCQTTTIPVCMVTSSTNYFTTTANPSADGGGFTESAVATRTSGSGPLNAVYGFSTGAANIGFGAAGTCTANLHSGAGPVTGSCTDGTIHSIIGDGSATTTTATMYVDGTAGTSVSSSVGGLNLTSVGVGAVTAGTSSCACQLSEVVVFAGFGGGSFQGIGSGGVATLRANQRAAFGF